MKSMILVALALVAVAAAAPAEQAPAQILRSEFDQQPAGGYNYGFESDDGVKRQETGELVEVLDEEKKPQNVITVRGSYSYNNPDGELEEITYYADENGFHAEGKSIPKNASR